jgi:flagellar basal-body rod protein FlgC
MLRTLDISTSGLVAQRHRLDTIAGNIAHANTTLDADGNVAPYRRRLITFMADEADEKSLGAGVKYRVELDTETPFRSVYDPSHPHADKQGIVKYPNVDMITEFSNALLATRAYEANIAVIDMTRQMAEQSMQILV